MARCYFLRDDLQSSLRPYARYNFRMSFDDPMPISGTLAQSDLVRFQYFHANRRWWPITLMFILFTLLAFFFIFVVLLTGDVERFKNPGLNYVIFLCFGMLFFLFPYRAAKRQYRSQQYFRERILCRVSDNGFRLEGSGFSTEIAWALMHNVYETKTAFLIYHTPRLAWILPKRFFTGQHEIEDWKKFVKAHLPNPKLFRRPARILSWF